MPELQPIPPPSNPFKLPPPGLGTIPSDDGSFAPGDKGTGEEEEKNDDDGVAGDKGTD